MRRVEIIERMPDGPATRTESSLEATRQSIADARCVYASSLMTTTVRGVAVATRAYPPFGAADWYVAVPLTGRRSGHSVPLPCRSLPESQ
jgi:hypothetical protein